MMSLLQKFKQSFTRPDFDEVLAYQYKLPSEVVVNVERVDGNLIARILQIDDKKLSKDTILTEASDIESLTHEINDLLLTYLEFPDNIKREMPTLVPPRELVKLLKKDNGKLTQPSAGLQFSFGK